MATGESWLDASRGSSAALSQVTTPKRYQLIGAKRIRDFNGCALLADEMGLGKSFTSLLWLSKYMPERPTIIVCPGSLKWNWANEASKHLGLRTEILSGQKIPKARLTKHHAPIIIINYEILHFWVNYLVTLNPKVVIWDEAHYIANRESIRFAALSFLIKEAKVPYRLALSGTPLTNRTADLWTTLHLLRPDKYPSFIKYGMKYCKPKLVHGKWVFSGSRHTDVLHRRLKKFVMIRRLKKDVASELPSKVRQLIILDLPAKAQNEYAYAEAHFVPWLKKNFPHKVKRAMKALHLTRLGYLLRLAARLKRKQGRQWLESFLAESDDKILVFSSSRKTLMWLKRKFPGITVVIDGQTNTKDRHKAVESFQKSKKLRIAACHPKAAGVGLNMTAASHVLHYDQPFAPGTMNQGDDRIHRLGQTKTCFIYYLAARDTKEERLCPLLMEKQEILDQVLDGRTKGSDLDIFNELLKD